MARRMKFTASGLSVTDATGTKLQTGQGQLIGRASPGEIILGGFRSGTSVLASTPYVISFPNFDVGPVSTGIAYSHTSHDDVSNPAAGWEECFTMIKLPGQEWGPGLPYNLADIDVGACPVGCNRLDIQVLLTRTVEPPAIYNYDRWPIEIVEGQWQSYPDGACTVESQNGMERMFWFEIVSGRVLLRRKMSIQSLAFYPGLNDLKVNSGPPNNSLADGGSNACNKINSNNYGSAYSGIVVITPNFTSNV